MVRVIDFLKLLIFIQMAVGKERPLTRLFGWIFGWIFRRIFGGSRGWFGRDIVINSDRRRGSWCASLSVSGCMRREVVMNNEWGCSSGPGRGSWCGSWCMRREVVMNKNGSIGSGSASTGRGSWCGSGSCNRSCDRYLEFINFMTRLVASGCRRVII